MSRDLLKSSQVYKAKHEYSTSLKLLQKAHEVSPGDTDISKEIASLAALIKKQKLSEKELAQRMFNNIGNDSNSNKKRRKKIDTKFQVWAIFGASLMVGLMSLAVYKFKYV